MIEYENLALLNKPFKKDYIKVAKAIIDKGWFVLGENVQLFEKEFAEYCGTSDCIGVASGLDALILSLNALDLPKGSEVLVPSNTYIATILAIIHNGFIPVLVEPDINTYNIDPNKIEEKITNKTKAIIVVHLYGKLCQMDKIVSITSRHNLFLIEDCAQAHGAMFKRQKAGTFGIFGAFSFYPTKNLGALGDGGAILTNNKQYAEKLRYLRNYGSKSKYYNEYIGFNSRLDELQAAFLRIKLKKLDVINEHKRNLANLYNIGLNNELIVKPKSDEVFFDVYHIYAIRNSNRSELRDYLFDNGIKTEIHYPVAPHRQKAMQNLFSEEFLISDEIHNSILSLPISYFHKFEDIIKIIDVINRWGN
ncbi:MAG: aminotransferase [Candidatus Margulisiibacteriota bacterium]|nr:MAG: aminotransferase [Candidatus Margulisiibacteriota bacterium]